ncbi:MAG TPA: hypothetical protein VHB97_25450, partial [Polyangia bacterium]|nr:hypothetical protein [Polyangia bacterium]
MLASVSAVGCDEKKTEAPVPPAQSGMPAAPASGTTAAAPSGATAAAPSGASAAPAGDTGSVTGVVTVTGKLPAMEDLKRNSDAFCAKKQMKDESVVADDKGHLANVLVHIIGLPATTNPPKEKATISQDDCMYRPRVLGVVDGQPLEIRNGDPVLHNVH